MDEGFCELIQRNVLDNPNATGEMLRKIFFYPAVGCMGGFDDFTLNPYHKFIIKIIQSETDSNYFTYVISTIWHNTLIVLEYGDDYLEFSYYEDNNLKMVYTNNRSSKESWRFETNV